MAFSTDSIDEPKVKQSKPVDNDEARKKFKEW